MTESAHLVNSIQKSRFPSTGIHLHPESQSHILTQSRYGQNTPTWLAENMLKTGIPIAKQQGLLVPFIDVRY